MKIDDLYFGVRYYDSNSKEMITANVFDLGRTRYWLAKWILYPKRYSMPLFQFVFADFRGKCEYEWLVSGLSGSENIKTDVYTEYLEPNEERLMEMMGKVSANSCRNYLKKWKTTK